MADRLPSEIRRALNECGRTWEIVNGSKHRKLFIDGRMVNVLPYSFDGGKVRGLLNIVSKIRKAGKDTDDA